MGETHTGNMPDPPVKYARPTREMGDLLYLSAVNMRPDYSHKIFGDKRLHPFLRLEACVRADAPVHRSPGAPR